MKSFLCGLYGALTFLAGTSTFLSIMSCGALLIEVNSIPGEAIYWLLGSALLTWLFGATHSKLED